MTEQVVITCTECGLPLDEMPDSSDQWLFLADTFAQAVRVLYEGSDEPLPTFTLLCVNCFNSHKDKTSRSEPADD
jgi:hypothetical protein